MFLHSPRQPTKLSQGNHHICMGLFNLSDDLRSVGVRVGQHDDAAHFERCIVGDNHLRHVGQHHHDTLAWLDTQAVECVSKLVHLPFQLLVSEYGAIKYGRCSLGYIVCR